MSQEEKDKLLKQQMKEQQAAVVPTTAMSRATTVNNNNDDDIILPSPTTLTREQSSMQARYEAVGLLFGDDSANNLLVEEGGDVGGDVGGGTTATPAVAATTSLASTVHLPESEDAVRERFRAATLAMGAGTTQEDEDQQLKNRELEERNYLSSTNTDTVLAESIATVGDSTTTNDSLTDEQAKQQARFVPSSCHRAEKPRNDDLVFVERSAPQATAAASSKTTSKGSPSKGSRTSSRMPSSSASSQSEKDMLAKSRGRPGTRRTPSQGGLHPEYADVVVGTASVPSATASTAGGQRVQVTPGAMAVSQGQAERLTKVRLTEQPMIGTGETTIPVQYANTTTSQPPEAPPRAVEEREEVLSLSPLIRTSSLAPPPPLMMADEEAPRSSNDDFVEDPRPLNEVSMDDDKVMVDISKPTSRRRWIWIGGIILLVCIVAGIGGGIAASGGDGGSTAGSPTMAPSRIESERFKSIKAVIADDITPASVLDDQGSPQHQALSWIADEDTTFSTTEDRNEMITRYTLAVMYYSTGGAEWINDWKLWLDANANECEWEGITCTDDGEVRGIEITENIGMEGYIPEELQHLSALRKLTMSLLDRFCCVSSTIQFSLLNFFYRFVWLDSGVLYIEYNPFLLGLQGSIPQLGKLHDVFE